MAARTPRFHALRVAGLRRETPDAVSIAFEVPPHLQSDFRFAAGQYLTLRRAFDGEEVRRSYSICSGPDDGELRIAVKRVDGGRFSTWANDAIHAGDVLDVMTPTGRFGVAYAPDEARVHVAFAAGSGITPILSIARGILAREQLSRVFLFYGSRSTGEMLFREKLEEMKDSAMGRLSVFHVLSREQQDVSVLNGRLDAEKVGLLLRYIVPAAVVDHAFICGPAGMSEEVEAALLALGSRPDQVHVERFVSALGGEPRPKPPRPHGPAQAETPHAVAALIVDGRRSEVPVAEGESVLDAALRAGLDLPYACKGGMCSTCRASVLEGAAEMAVNFSLEPWEVEAGFVLTCQARPTSPRVVIDYDQM
jgi:ring-1,2-phenylacetyl-CoA epoxidase subunit PaaE